MFHLIRGSFYLAVIRASFSLFFLYTSLVTIFTYIVFIFEIWIYIYIWWCMSSSPTSTCVVSFLSLYTCFLFNVCNLIFLFHTKMLWWVLFKVFQKYRLSKSSMPWTLFLQSFLRVCIRVDFIVFNNWLWVEWFMPSLILHLFIVVLSWIAKVGDC